VAQHLFREGHFELATLFVKEASVAMPAAYQEPYVHMHGVLQQIKLRNLGKRVCVCVCERERERERARKEALLRGTFRVAGYQREEKRPNTNTGAATSPMG
jgi:hypothetical protein